MSYHIQQVTCFRLRISQLVKEICVKSWLNTHTLPLWTHSSAFFFANFLLRVHNESSYCRAMCMLELLMLKRHILFVPDGDFTASDIDEVIRSMIV